MNKYILFDFDGTIADTNELIILSLNKTAEKYMGRKLYKEEIESIFGKYLEDQMKELCPEKYKDMVLFYKEFYSTHKEDMAKAFPGIREMLSELKAKGCKTAVVSAKGRSGIEHGLDKLGIAGYIDVIVSAYDIQNNKPHPEPAFKALKLLGCKDPKVLYKYGNSALDTGNEPLFCENANVEEYFALMVGDSSYDILCGKNAGIKTALVGWTVLPKKPLLDLKPDYYIKTPSELAKIISLMP